jgi:hypothetical protein
VSKLFGHFIDALDNVRELGNFGAHPEKDDSKIIDITEEDARKIISAIEVVIDDWFIEPARRNTRLAALKPITEQNI